MELTDGTLLFAYSRFAGNSWNDHASADIALIRSKDGGKIWSEPEILIHQEAGWGNVMSVSFLRLHSGRILLVHGRKRLVEDSPDARPVCYFSDDDGKTWSEPTTIINSPGYFVHNNDRLVQLRSGRILLPTAFHRWKHDDRSGIDYRGIGVVFFSDNDGETWSEAPGLVYPIQTGMHNLQKPGIVELDNGELMLWARTDLGCQYKSFSFDNGMTWSAIMPAPEFPSPTSPLSIKRAPASGDLIAVWNDYSPKYGVIPANGSWGRTPLVIARSSDDGAHWNDHTPLETDPASGFCYTAIHFNRDNSILLAYCGGGAPHGTAVLQDLVIRRIVGF